MYSMYSIHIPTSCLSVQPCVLTKFTPPLCYSSLIEMKKGTAFYQHRCCLSEHGLSGGCGCQHCLEKEKKKMQWTVLIGVLLMVNCPFASTIELSFGNSTVLIQETQRNRGGFIFLFLLFFHTVPLVCLCLNTLLETMSASWN